MLWMLGVVAILVDVVSRFSGNEHEVKSPPPKIVIHHTTPPPPPPPLHTLLLDMSHTPHKQPPSPEPIVDVTYIVVNEKKQAPPPPPPLNPLDNNEISIPEPLSIQETLPAKMMEPSDIEIEKTANNPYNNTNDGNITVNALSSDVEVHKKG